MTDRSVRALKVASAILLSAGVIGSIVLLGHATNILVASLTAATLVVAIVVATVALGSRRRGADPHDCPTPAGGWWGTAEGPRPVGGPPLTPWWEDSGGARPPAPIDDDVQFTVYRPARVRPAQWYPLLAFAHKITPFPGTDATMIDPITLVEQQAQELLGEQPVPFHKLIADSSLQLQRGSELVVEPWLDGAELEPLRVWLRWTEPVHSVRFKLRVPISADGCRLVGGLRVFLGVVLIGEVTFQVSVSSAAPPHASPLERLPVRRFRQIFASYSHRDADVVRAVADYATVVGDRYIIDVQSLRSGEVWQPRLAELIGQSDIFQLFWSRNAMASPHVRHEWEHALQLGREGFIRPVYWQEPRPADPSRDLPPEALARLHWSKLAIRAAPPAMSRPRPSPVHDLDDDETRLSPSDPWPPAPLPAPPMQRRRSRSIAPVLVTIVLVVIAAVIIVLTLLR